VIELYFADESGFAPSQPTAYTWARRKVRPFIKFEATCRRRVNVLGALRYGATQPQPEQRVVWASRTRTTSWDSQSFLEFVWRKIAGLSTPPGELPAGWRPGRRKVVVLDNYRVHHSQLVKAHLDLLKRAGVVFFYLPPYSPELHLIEAEWRQIKYQELPQRSFEKLDELVQAVEIAMQQGAAAA